MIKRRINHHHHYHDEVMVVSHLKHNNNDKTNRCYWFLTMMTQQRQHSTVMLIMMFMMNIMISTSTSSTTTTSDYWISSSSSNTKSLSLSSSSSSSTASSTTNHNYFKTSSSSLLAFQNNNQYNNQHQPHRYGSRIATLSSSSSSLLLFSPRYCEHSNNPIRRNIIHNSFKKKKDDIDMMMLHSTSSFVDFGIRQQQQRWSTRSQQQQHQRRRFLSSLFTSSSDDIEIETTTGNMNNNNVTDDSTSNIVLNTDSNKKNNKNDNWLIRLISIVSQQTNSRRIFPEYRIMNNDHDKKKTQFLTLLRVSIPSVLSAIIATLLFPGMAILLASYITEPGVFTILSQDSSQFVQNFLSVASLLFSILVGQTYYFLYTQQESVYYALFEEVTEAKSLLEQVALVCQGRAMYRRCLEAIALYVNSDLKQVQADPAILLSARPIDDPLESIMYMTSVGVPSTVYETVKSLREARARRLGALQRKLPSIHMMLLWILAGIELISFPLLGAGTQSVGGYKILTIEGILFGVMTGGIVLTLRIVGELWRPAGGAYNVDAVLSVMVSGLEQELKARMSSYSSNNAIQRKSNTYSPTEASIDRQRKWMSSSSSPSSTSSIVDNDSSQQVLLNTKNQNRNNTTTSQIKNNSDIIQTQGADISFIVKRIWKWISKNKK